MERGKQKRMALLRSAGAVALSAALMAGLIVLVSFGKIPNPNMILITALVLCTGVFGLLSGAVAGGMMMAYSMYFFSTDHSFFSYDALNIRKILVILLGIALNYLGVGLLKHSRDAHQARLRQTNEELKHANEQLRREAENARRIAELTRSVASLLTNMPAMTFSKDVETGKYLACNQAFAQFAGCTAPAEVVGLTDFELFDEATARRFREDDRKAMGREEPCRLLEDVKDARGEWRQFQTTKLKFTDERGRVCLLGMSTDRTEVLSMQRESDRNRQAYEEVRVEMLTYSHIARALSADYEELYYVDTATDRFFSLNPRAGQDELLVDRRGGEFFRQCREEAKEQLYEEDLDVFLEDFQKEKVLRAIDEHGSYSITYRRLINGAPLYYNIKTTRMEEGYIILGVSNVDAHMKSREAAERMKEEQATYQRINALAGGYLCIYTVDPETSRYSQYSATPDYEGMGITREGDDFFEAARSQCVHTFYLEDVDRFLSSFTREQVLGEIQRSGSFSLNYRLMLHGAPNYVSLRAALVEEKDGPQLIIGISDIDAQVRREQEYEWSLSEAWSEARRDALTGAKNKHAYVDVETQLNHRIEEGDHMEFALVVCDVNGLKAVNDTRGHRAGDRLIQDACGLISQVFRHSSVYRVGGDEFTVLVQGQDYQQLDALMEQVERHNRQSGSLGEVVVACGMARYQGERNVAGVFERADGKMYENKKQLKQRT